MELVSVIVPVWNAEEYLQKCINSICNQTYQTLEIILVDDGSTDGSYTICKAYEKLDARIKVFHKENGGQASARNYGLDQCTGKYVSFVDDDDWIYPEFVEKLYKYIQEYNADIARCEDTSSVEWQKEPLKVKVLDKNEYFGLLYQDILGGHVTDRLFKIELIQNVRFPQSKTIEDMRFMREVIPHVDREVVTNEKLYFYTLRENNTSFVYGRNYVSSYERAVEFQSRYYEAREKYPMYQELLLQKATSFACGCYRILKHDKIHQEELNVMKHFLKQNKKEILDSKIIKLKYKIFVKIL